MKCDICKKEVVLVPSAKERAKKYGNTPAHYTRLFKTHSSCSLQLRQQRTTELMRRLA